MRLPKKRLSHSVPWTLETPGGLGAVPRSTRLIKQSHLSVDYWFDLHITVSAFTYIYS